MREVMHLFFQGPRKMGKSSVLRSMLLPHEKNLCGLVVQRLLEEGRQVGFRAVKLKESYPALEIPYACDLDGVFILRGIKKTSVLEEVILEAQKDIGERRCKIIVLDEIGGIELLSPVFMRTLEQILQSGKPCIGVLKSEENLAHTASELHLEQSYFTNRRLLEKMILREGEVISLEQKGSPFMEPIIKAFLLREHME